MLGGFSRHGVYEKYHYQRLIEILRVRCRRCRKTHALIPSFSVPGTSVGMKEVESFIFRRAAGASRMEAGRHLSLQGLGEDYLRSIERRLLTGIHKAKALFPDRGDHTLSAWQWLIDVAEGSAHPVYRLNTLSTVAGWGAIFCALAAEAGRRSSKAGPGISHNIASARMSGQSVDSG